MATDKELAKLKAIASHYRIGVRFAREPHYVPTYDRHSIYKSYIEMDVRIQDLIRDQSGHKGLGNRLGRFVAHELGHFIVAPGGRRYRRNFGITEGRRSERSSDHWDLDEYKAQLVENYILRLCGFGKRFRLPKNPLWKQSRRGYRMAREALKWWDTVGKELIQKELSFPLK